MKVVIDLLLPLLEHLLLAVEPEVEKWLIAEIEALISKLNNVLSAKKVETRHTV